MQLRLRVKSNKNTYTRVIGLRFDAYRVYAVMRGAYTISCVSYLRFDAYFAYALARRPHLCDQSDPLIHA